MRDWDTAQRLIREYGDCAEAECEARCRYFKMLGDDASADEWQKVKSTLGLLRTQNGEPA